MSKEGKMVKEEIGDDRKERKREKKNKGENREKILKKEKWKKKNKTKFLIFSLHYSYTLLDQTSNARKNFIFENTIPLTLLKGQFL